MPVDPDPSLPFQSLAVVAREALASREAAALRRERRVVEPVDATHAVVDGKAVINFSSNDYLGLTHHPAIRNAIALAASATAGSGAAPLITGRTPAHSAAERALADWKGVEDAILLPSGFQANLAAVGGIAEMAAAAGRSVRFIADKLVHASLIDAIAATGAELRVVPHNGLAKLERLVAEWNSTRLDVFVTESIFSMDGDAADLRGIVELKRRHGFALVLDEAHATGLFGGDGAGLASSLGVSHEVDVSVLTMSKALGLVGGAVCGSRMIVDSIVNFGRAYVFSTSPPAFIAEGVGAAVEVVRTDQDRRRRLFANVQRLRDGLRSAGVAALEGPSPIVAVVMGDSAAALDASRRLFDAGYLVVAVRPPTVPPGTSRLRVTVSSEHTSDEIDGLVQAIATLRSPPPGSGER